MNQWDGNDEGKASNQARERKVCVSSFFLLLDASYVCQRRMTRVVVVVRLESFFFLLSFYVSAGKAKHE